MEILTAKTAGFCYGVARAVKCAYDNLDKMPLVTYGPIIHNSSVIKDLEEKGVYAASDVSSIAAGTNVLIRSHGVAPEIYGEMDKKALNYIDCTCPDVKKIHNIILERQAVGDKIILIGDKNHPEVIAANGYAGYQGIILGTLTEAGEFLPEEEKPYAVVVQTTFKKGLFQQMIAVLKEKIKSIAIYDTICNTTDIRQKEAAEISKKVDHMLVIGDKKSSNTTKLYETCKKNCKNTHFIESIHEIELNIFNTNDKIGITAGASTPPAIIKEAVKTMSELDNTKNNQTFEEMLNESFVTLHTGDVVKGTVIQIANGEVSVNLGYKSDGIISRAEYSDDPNVDPATDLQVGDEIEVFVVRVNDGEGNVLLSKKRLEIQKGYTDIEQAYNEKTVINGKIIDVVKGGLIALIKGIRVFVPSSQISSRFVDNLEKFKGQEFDFNILEYDTEKQRRRIVAGRKELAIQEEKEKKQQIFNTLEEGQRVQGTVSRLVDFGAFVDLGGVDGLIHISEMSWGRVKKASDILKEGDVVTVTVLGVDKEKEKISLSLKDIEANPWNNIEAKYPVGEIVEGKVVRMVPFGAFIELEVGVDGLVHISQIAAKHVVKPEDELTIGEMINVKIMEVDTENKKISLSKKEADGVGDPEFEEEIAEAGVADAEENVYEQEEQEVSQNEETEKPVTEEEA